MNAYGRLMRFDKPVGTALLWAPTAWALWLANHGAPSIKLVLYFFLGTVLMRAAGCVVNDMVDRSIDKEVKRTRLRPLASGELRLSQALRVLAGLLGLSGLIALQLPRTCWLEAGLALGITLAYPFAKRWLQAPQLILGLAFSMGIPMAYSASSALFDATMTLLFVLNFLWILAYDTLYALMDQEDDLRIGVHSTAILFDTHLPKIMVLLQIGFHGVWLYLGMTQVVSEWFDVCWVVGVGILNYQHTLLKKQTVDAYLQAFWWHAGYGLLMWMALL